MHLEMRWIMLFLQYSSCPVSENLLLELTSININSVAFFPLYLELSTKTPVHLNRWEMEEVSL